MIRHGCGCSVRWRCLWGQKSLSHLMYIGTALHSVWHQLSVPPTQQLQTHAQQCHTRFRGSHCKMTQAISRSGSPRTSSLIHDHMFHINTYNEWHTKCSKNLTSAATRTKNTNTRRNNRHEPRTNGTDPRAISIQYIIIRLQRVEPRSARL